LWYGKLVNISVYVVIINNNNKSFDDKKLVFLKSGKAAGSDYDFMMYVV